jgi:uncharacterized membrane protein YagU involved in acid resistance
MQFDVFVMIAAGGVLATYAHLVLALWAPRVGLPRIDFSMGIAELTWGESFDGKAPYWMGFAAIHMNGIIFALLYSTVVAQYLPGIPVVRGLIYGAILFIPAQFFFVPLFLQGGIMGLKHHRMAWLTAIIVHGVYGAIVGWLCPIVL